MAVRASFSCFGKDCLFCKTNRVGSRFCICGFSVFAYTDLSKAGLDFLIGGLEALTRPDKARLTGTVQQKPDTLTASNATPNLRPPMHHAYRSDLGPMLHGAAYK